MARHPFLFPATEEWLAALPEVIPTLCGRWRLERDGPLINGSTGLIVPVRRGDRKQMLKIVPQASDAGLAASALRAWNGGGAALLLDADIELGALLMERVTGDPLERHPFEEMLSVAGGLLQRLAITSPAEIPHLSDWLAGFEDEVERGGLDSRLPSFLLDEAADLAAALCASAGNRLVHYDLHGENILSSDREPWLAIDPKVVGGDLEFGLAQLLWRRLDELGGPRDIQRALELLCDSADLDIVRARSWSRVRCVEYWLWGLKMGLTEDPIRCEVLLEWL